MFPKELDGAKVLYYTDKNDFGVVANEDGSSAEHICYLALCQYDNDTGYYLFLCDENYEVVTDNLFDSTEQCFETACHKNDHIIWHDYA